MLGFLTTLVVLYLGLVLLLVVFEKSFIFFPQFPGRLSGDWHPEGLPVEDVWLRAADAVKLHAWWIAAPGAEFTFVAFHGNAANIANREDIYRFLRTVPVNVLKTTWGRKRRMIRTASSSRTCFGQSPSVSSKERVNPKS